MLHCPYCSGFIKEEEIYCAQCGKKIPDDIGMRSSRQANRLWFLPFLILLISLLSVGSFYLYLDKKEERAKESYSTGEKFVVNGNYQQALDAFKLAVEQKANFPTAQENIAFLETAIGLKTDLNNANSLTKKSQYQEALQLLNKAETTLNKYEGEAAEQLLELINKQRQSTQLEQLEENLANDPTVDQLKTLLWEAESIGDARADSIANTIRKQIVSFVFSTASEQLANKNFTHARNTVEDGLQYAPDSEKLISFKTTIEKEKTAFEIAQQKRIEQAITAAEEERQKNKNDAVTLIDIELEQDEQANVVVKGKIRSVATVPINTISVEYVITDDQDNTMIENEVYVYPETLYPEEEGKFEYTHFDKNDNMSQLDKATNVKVKKIKWFLD
ncbi:tetratricopeptide repeat protein [Aquibacillus salsiterrae]|uniref:Zinc ribbon domain-containing protein n=1 Tax=Aquibacillus salsiterrae TaxID=2950439 RepID=A0A9X3WBH6_9BACI|nr:zinc ribbon domain-containing protein [Aquibacillus salsiterrae]MDC3416555.1 zinc ribbon domain-containing protein [Aquibacillus salsiterrae]